MNRLLISLLVTSVIVIGICSASPVPVREKLWNSDEDILTQNRVNLRRRRQYDVDGGLTPPPVPEAPEPDPDEPEGLRKKRQISEGETVEVAPDGKPAHEEGRTQSKSGYGLGYAEPTQGAGEVETDEVDEAVERVRRDEEAVSVDRNVAPDQSEGETAHDTKGTLLKLSENDEETLAKIAGDMGVDKTRYRRQWTVDDPVTDVDETKGGEPQDAQRKRRQSMVDDADMDEAEDGGAAPAEPPVDDNEEGTRHEVEPRKGVEMDEVDETSPSEAAEENQHESAVVEDTQAIDGGEDTMESDDEGQKEEDVTNVATENSNDDEKREDESEAGEEGSIPAETPTEAEPIDGQEKEDEMTTGTDDPASTSDAQDEASIAEESALEREARAEDGAELNDDDENSQDSVDKLLAEEKLQKESEALLEN